MQKRRVLTILVVSLYCEAHIVNFVRRVARRRRDDYAPVCPGRRVPGTSTACFEKSTGSGSGISRGEIMSGGAGETSCSSVELMLLGIRGRWGSVVHSDRPCVLCRVLHVKSVADARAASTTLDSDAAGSQRQQRSGEETLKQSLRLMVHEHAKHIIVYMIHGIN